MTYAQTTTYACQFQSAGGLKWEGRQWKTKSFVLNKPFFITYSKNQIDKSSLTGVLEDDDIEKIDCYTYPLGGTSCSLKGLAMFGKYFVFDTRTKNGSLTYVLGSTMNAETYRDSVSVKVFTCQKM